MASPEPTPARGGALPRVLLALGIVLAATIATGTRGSTAIQHVFEGPVFRAGQPIDHAAELVERKPEVVLLGNSLLKRGVAIVPFGEGVGASAMKVFHGGGASALYYVLLKHLIVPLDKRPKVVAIFHRHVYLTQPTYRNFGIYKQNMDYYVQGEDSELDRIGFLPGMGRIEYFLKSNWSLYDRREEWREDIEELFKRDLLGYVTGLGQVEFRTSVEQVFELEQADSADDSEPERLHAAPLPADAWDFAANVEHSFLPRIIAIAEEAGIQLVMVRLRTLPDAKQTANHVRPRQDEFDAYSRDFDAYMEEWGVPVLDFTSEARLRPEHFRGDDHLNDTGKEIFTDLLIPRFVPIMQGL